MKLLKKLILISSFILSLASIGLAQSVDFGIKGGLNIISGKSEISDFKIRDGIVDVNSQVGIYLGGLVTFHTKAPKLKFQTEIFYQLNKTGAIRGEVSRRFNFHQITIPVLAKYQFAKKLSLTGGGYLSVNFVEGNNFYFDDFKKIDLGALLGLEYQLTKKFLVDIRYNYGLTNLISNNTDSVRNITRYKRIFNIGIAYQL